MAGNDVYLYSVPSDADSDDVRLRDPTIPGAGGPVSASLTASIGQITLASDADVIVGAAMTASVGNITLTSDVDVVVGASLTASIGAITLASDVDVIVGASLTASIGAIGLSASATITGAGTVVEDTASKGGWDPYYYKRRKKPVSVGPFGDDWTPPAPRPVALPPPYVPQGWASNIALLQPRPRIDYAALAAQEETQRRLAEEEDDEEIMLLLAA